MATALGDVPANSQLGGLTDFTLGHLPGVAASGNAAAGEVGELVETAIATGGAISLVSGTPKTVMFVSLTAGDWDVEGRVTFKYNAATQSADAQGCISGSDNVLITSGKEGYDNTRQVTTTSNKSISVPRQRVSQSGTASWFLVAQATVSAGSVTAFGYISARRVR